VQENGEEGAMHENGAKENVFVLSKIYFNLHLEEK